jgi:hypothetical protein
MDIRFIAVGGLALIVVAFWIWTLWDDVNPKRRRMPFEWEVRKGKHRPLLILLICALSLIGFVSICATPAECSWCPRITCYGPGYCPDGCMCLIEGGALSGRCVSME